MRSHVRLRLEASEFFTRRRQHRDGGHGREGQTSRQGEAMPDFADSSYDQHFDVLRADTPDRLDAAYRLRYQVYCVENRFEDRERCPDGREVDDDDDRSVHTLLVHRRSGAAIGAARLILPRPQSGRPLPIERLAHPGARDIAAASAAPPNGGGLPLCRVKRISPAAR